MLINEVELEYIRRNNNLLGLMTTK